METCLFLWRKGKVVFIPKLGKIGHSVAKAYWPISLSSFILKVHCFFLAESSPVFLNQLSTQNKKYQHMQTLQQSRLLAFLITKRSNKKWKKLLGTSVYGPKNLAGITRRMIDFDTPRQQGVKLMLSSSDQLLSAIFTPKLD